MLVQVIAYVLFSCLFRQERIEDVQFKLFLLHTRVVGLQDGDVLSVRLDHLLDDRLCEYVRQNGDTLFDRLIRDVDRDFLPVGVRGRFLMERNKTVVQEILRYFLVFRDFFHKGRLQNLIEPEFRFELGQSVVLFRL